MPIDTVLARAEADLAAGRVPLARQRLRSLIGTHPTDLTARHRLAAVYRLYGDAAEAGRWNYLDESADPAETAAFEARYADPLRRMRALRWHHPESRAATATARARLAALREAASAACGRPLTWAGRDDSPDTVAEDGDGGEGEDDAWFLVILAAVLLLVLALSVVGLVTVLGWIC
ncbi:hypothetical protein GCM10009759_74110 [Kitasatospora saccharophila]|uniref:Tetratricopeptide repeat protein n=1 Tax=Kitasatospora saccharophila TaxID=407973 RepID=A0ABP5K1C4_9ACTN